MILDCKSVAAELWLPPAASLWRSEVDRRKNVRYSCTGAVVGPTESAMPAAANQGGTLRQFLRREKNV